MDVDLSDSRARWLVLGAAMVAGILVLTLSLNTDLGGGADKAPEGRPGTGHRATAADLEATHDPFGIDYLMRTLPRGTLWVSDWGPKREFDGVDPDDPWFDADHSRASYETGHGRMTISGEVPRMYVHDPALKRQWRDVEVTMYVKRVSDSGVPYAGMTAVARSNHLAATGQGNPQLCDTRGYGGRLRFDGHADFEKETAHPQNDTTGNVTIWPDGMPRNVWIGYKYLVYDEPDGVHLELWVDRTDGDSGGDWHLVDSAVDDGNLFGEEPCAAGVNPRMKLTNSPSRKGSESGKPNVSVYFRSDGIGTDGLVYKRGSIREITPIRSSQPSDEGS